ncbi:MAG: ERCC4 domain-containing protein [Candidatus Aenigmatarchaeota archaeon]
MERQLSLPTNNLQIFADYREKEIIEFLREFGVKVNVVNLEVCDFVFNNLGVERKSFCDFISSILDGRIFNQAKKMVETYEKRLIIVEGIEEVERINENYYFSVLSFLALSGINIVFTKNKLETAKMIYWLIRKEKENRDLMVASFKISKKEKEINKIQEKILSAFPGISKILSRRILKRFKSIKNFVLASEKELMRVEGIGEKLSKNIKKIIETEYKGD